MHYQWYPGHMIKAKRQMQEDLKLIDVIIELVDARIPFSSKNPDIDELAKGKSRVLLLNKADMADNRVTELWKKHYEAKEYFTALVNSRNGNGVKAVQDVVMEACKAKIERDRRRGILNRPIRAMIAGIPNVGKSTFINSFAGKACTRTGDKPGVTKGKQWIRLNRSVELLDTPGILWPRFENQEIGKKIAMIGSINTDILQPVELCLDFMKYVMPHYPKALAKRYDAENCIDPLEMLEKAALKCGCLLKGGKADYDRTAMTVMEDFRSLRLGTISLELPEEVTA